MEKKYPASWMSIDWADLDRQIKKKIADMKRMSIDMTIDKFCKKAWLTYAWILNSRKTNRMRIKNINKLRKVWINIEILW